MAGVDRDFSGFARKIHRDSTLARLDPLEVSVNLDFYGHREGTSIRNVPFKVKRLPLPARFEHR